MKNSFVFSLGGLPKFPFISDVYSVIMYTLCVLYAMPCILPSHVLQESRAVAGNPRDAAVIFDP